MIGVPRGSTTQPQTVALRIRMDPFEDRARPFLLSQGGVSLIRFATSRTRAGISWVRGTARRSPLPAAVSAPGRTGRAAPGRNRNLRRFLEPALLAAVAAVDEAGHPSRAASRASTRSHRQHPVVAHPPE
jgi:hypothetical protein